MNAFVRRSARALALVLAASLGAVPAGAAAAAYSNGLRAQFVAGCMQENPGRPAYCACALRETERSMSAEDFVADSHANEKLESGAHLSDDDVTKVALLREMMRSAGKSCAAVPH